MITQFLSAIISSIFDSSMIALLLNTKRKKIYCFLCSFIIIFFIQLFVSVFYHGTIIPIFILLILFISVGTIIYQDSLKHIFIAFAIDLFFQLFSEIILMLLCAVFMKKDTVYIFYNDTSFSVLMYCILMIIYGFVLFVINNVTHKMIHKTKIENSIIILCPCIVCIYLYAIMYSFHTGTSYFANLIILAILFVLIAYSLISLYRKQQEQHQLEIEKNKLEIIINNNKEIRKIHHDIANHLYTMQTLFEVDEQEAMNYSHSLLEQYKHMYHFEYLLNSIFDYLSINKENIDMQIHVKNKNDLLSFQMSSILPLIIKEDIQSFEVHEINNQIQIHTIYRNVHQFDNIKGMVNSWSIDETNKEMILWIDKEES